MPGSLLVEAALVDLVMQTPLGLLPGGQSRWIRTPAVMTLVLTRTGLDGSAETATIFLCIKYVKAFLTWNDTKCFLILVGTDGREQVPTGKEQLA